MGADAGATTNRPTVLVLTPVKDAAHEAAAYVERLGALTYPAAQLSLGLLESDSADGTYEVFDEALEPLRSRWRRVGLWRRDFGYRLPPGRPRWDPALQLERRTVLARSRNHLLSRALQDEDWVLWLDVDVVEFQPDIVELLLSLGRDILQPHCVREWGGRTFDTNAWRDRGTLHLDDLRGGQFLVELHAVGGTMLLVRADCHRDGLVFPPFPYGVGNERVRTEPTIGRTTIGEVETEGLGIMAHDMGLTCWGIPALEIRHR